jgi:hypothetical protein
MDIMIHIPLTPRYAISILPANEKTLHNSFYRVLYNDDQVISINHDIEKYHQRYLLGSKEALESYLREVPAYKAPAPLNHPKILEIQSLAAATQGLVHVSERYGPFSKEVKDYFNWCWNNLEAFREDPNAQQLKQQMNDWSDH